MTRSGKRSWIAEHPWEAFIVLLLVIWAANQLIPLLWMYSMSVKSDIDVVRYPLRLVWPPKLSNYPEAWTGERTGVNLSLYFRNSAIVVPSSLLLLVAVATLAGYSFGRFEFPGRRSLFLFLVSLIAVPMHALIVPLYAELKAFGLINNFLGLILLYVTSNLPFSILILQSYFTTFPSDLEDAALIDGCNRFSTFWRVAVPISKGAISAIAIVNFIGMWNEVLLAILVLWEDKVRTMAPGLLGYMAQYGETRWGLIFAGLSIVTIPLIAFYVVFHNNIMKGATLGSYR
jgi:ABC-type glycerol-3-phosphate transport system permease component